MNTDLLTYELQRHHVPATTPVDDELMRHRAALVRGRRAARRHRLAERVRSVADRLDV